MESESTSSNEQHRSKSNSLNLKERVEQSKSIEFEKLKKHLFTSGELYEDPSFPADGRSIYYSKTTPKNITWKRPHQIVGGSENPKFISKGSVRFDVDQHALGDCWYLAALSTIVMRPALFETVVPMDQSFDNEYAGIFEFRFWRFGKWEQIVIDDRLPFDTTTDRLIFCHNRDEPNEFWSALCEKAYAKCFGCYEALEGGFPQDALVDLTSCISERIPLKDKVENKDMLWRTMLRSNDVEFGLLLTSVIYATRKSETEKTGEVKLDTGLYGGHAYSVTGVQEIDINENVNDVRLVRVRNPWGSKEEWKGKWADDDEKWNSVPEDVRKTLGLTLAPDGEFWMSFKDFIANFDDLMLGHLTPDSLSPMFFARSRQHILDKEKFEWQKKSIYGEWVRGATAGGHLDRMHTNPQFQVELKQLPGNPSDALCPLVISLMQMNRRKMLTTTTGKVDDLAISCFLYKPISNDLPRSSINKSYPRDGLNRIDYLQFSYQRENAKTFLLPPGTYVVIPCCWDADKEGEFFMRFMSPGGVSVESLDGDSTPIVIVKPELDTLEKLFEKLCGEDQVIDAFDLQQILKELLSEVFNISEPFSRTTCIRILECFDGAANKRLNRAEVKECWESIKIYHSTFQQFDQNNDGFFDAMEMPKGFKHLKINISRRIHAVLVKLYGTKRGLMNQEGFIMAVTTLLFYSRKWERSAQYTFGTINFNEYLLWELNDEVPEVMKQTNDSFCIIL